MRPLRRPAERAVGGAPKLVDAAVATWTVCQQIARAPRVLHAHDVPLAQGHGARAAKVALRPQLRLDVRLTSASQVRVRAPPRVRHPDGESGRACQLELHLRRTPAPAVPVVVVCASWMVHLHEVVMARVGIRVRGAVPPPRRPRRERWRRARARRRRSRRRRRARRHRRSWRRVRARRTGRERRRILDGVVPQLVLARRRRARRPHRRAVWSASEAQLRRATAARSARVRPDGARQAVLESRRRPRHAGRRAGHVGTRKHACAGARPQPVVVAACRVVEVGLPRRVVWRHVGAEEDCGAGVAERAARVEGRQHLAGDALRCTHVDEPRPASSL